jgi:hypothetical protein
VRLAIWEEVVLLEVDVRLAVWEEAVLLDVR